ncbi:MAG: glycosyltransferase [Clostridia bacterium]|nr:glycosyltransferase [Clostridia bacterium]
MANNDDIMVSICCLAYNHEKYIRQALDSFLMQKTDFKYEILVHDDASTDKTTDIIREYEEKYPDIVKPIYQKDNQYSKGVKISPTYQYPRAKGKYIALCEGDDFWTDENKLQKQFDVMEKHMECSMCTHASYRVNLESIDMKDNICGYSEKTIINLSEHLSNLFDGQEWKMPFQTSSFFARKECVDEMVLLKPKFVLECNIGDVPLTLFVLTKGNILFLPDLMSAYRVGREGAWTSRKLTVAEKINQMDNRIDLYENFKEFYPAIEDDIINNYICFYKLQKCTLAKQYSDLRKDKQLKWYLKGHYSLKQYVSFQLRSYPLIGRLYNIIRGQ